MHTDTAHRRNDIFAARPLSWLEGRLPGWQSRSLWVLLSGRDRHYHGVDTIDTLWRRHLSLGGSRDDDVAAFSIAYRHAIMLPQPGAGKLASVELWVDHAKRAGKQESLVDAVTECLLAAVDPVTVSPDAPAHVRWSADMDLLYLAEERHVVERTLKDMRLDYGGSDLDFAAHVAGQMQTLLMAPAIYRTIGIRERHEEIARENARRVFCLTSRDLSRTIHTIPFN